MVLKKAGYTGFVNVCVFTLSIVRCNFKSYFKTNVEYLITIKEGEDTNITSNMIYRKVFRNL